MASGNTKRGKWGSIGRDGDFVCIKTCQTKTRNGKKSGRGRNWYVVWFGRNFLT